MTDTIAQGRQASPMGLQALRLEDLARILSALGPRPITLKLLQADIDAGAPTNADGSMNLIHYVAWLIKELGRGDCPQAIASQRAMPAGQFHAAGHGLGRAAVAPASHPGGLSRRRWAAC